MRYDVEATDYLNWAVFKQAVMSSRPMLHGVCHLAVAPTFNEDELELGPAKSEGYNFRCSAEQWFSVQHFWGPVETLRAVSLGC